MIDPSSDDFIFFADLGKTIKVGNTIFDVLVSINNDDFKSGNSNMRTRRLVLEIRTRDAQNMDTNTTFIYDSVTYRVFKKDILDDGLFSRIEAEVAKNV